MKTFKPFSIFISFCLLANATSIKYSHDRYDIFEITKNIGPNHNGHDLGIYFFRPNQIISSDSLYSIINKALSEYADSLKPDGNGLLNKYSSDNSDFSMYRYSFGLIFKKLFNVNSYSINVYFVPEKHLIGISSLKWQSIFIGPSKQSNKFSNKILKIIMSKFDYPEYIGFSKTRCMIKENSTSVYGIKDFWKWFKRYEEYLFEYKNEEEINDYIKRKLEDASYDLSFEIGSVKNNKRELIIKCSEYMIKRVTIYIPTLEHWSVKVNLKKKNAALN